MTKKFMTGLLAAVLGVAMAQGPGAKRFAADAAGHGRGALAQMDALKTFLGLSDTQVTALKQVRTDAFDQSKPNRQENAQKARDLRTEMAKTNPDSATVGRLMTELKQARSQSASTLSQIHDQSLAVLTDAQKAKLKALEDAAALQSAVREARMAGLLAPSADSLDGSRMHMQRGFGPGR